MSTHLIYLASPYSHHDAITREMRYLAAMACVKELSLQGILVFSPIVYSHALAVKGNLPDGFGFWQELDLEMIERCDEVWVLCLPGWDESKGVENEIEHASEHNKPVGYIHQRFDSFEYRFPYPPDLSPIQ